MENANNIQMDSTSKYLGVLREYKGAVSKLFPSLTKDTLDSVSISPADALFLGYFLDYYPRNVAVYERGVSLGASTFFFARHPKVSKVVTIGSNSPVTKVATSGSGSLNGNGDVGSTVGARRLEVVRTVFAEYAVQRQKIKLYDSAESPVDPIEESNPVAEQEAGSSSATGHVTLLRDPHNRTEVSGALGAIFKHYPQAIVLLSNCRGSKGPFIQAGAVDFIEGTRDDYCFRLVSDLGLGLSSSSLGIVYSGEMARETDEVFGEVSGQFSERLDPLRLLKREEELIQSVYQTKKQPSKQPSKQVDELNKQISTLTQRNKHLENHYSSRRYKLADAIMDKVLRVKLLKRFIR